MLSCCRIERRAATARTVAALPAGARITDYISLGVITKTFPLTTVRSVLAASGKASLRQRDLPAHVVIYYVIALALYTQASYREVLRCLLDGLQWLLDPSAPHKVAGIAASPASPNTVQLHECETIYCRAWPQTYAACCGSIPYLNGIGPRS
jgi:Insertion element 4 transposase N-terminal